MSILDKRLNAWRDDIANVALEGKVTSLKFVESKLQQVTTPIVTLRRGPGYNFPQDSELLLGDFVKVFEEKDDWAWIQNCRDNYVGYCPIADLGELTPAPTHQISALRTFVFAEPNLKTKPISSLSMTSSVCLIEEGEKFSQLHSGGWIYNKHLSDIDKFEADYVSTAQKFLNVPYLWGGCSSLGIDCSGLVQIALRRAGHSVLRDTDMQESSIGEAVAYNGNQSMLKQGDFIFWKGHVGIFCDEGMLLHANATDMMVSKTSFSKFCSYILEIENSSVKAVRRL